jgi:hypothetical protein
MATGVVSRFLWSGSRLLCAQAYAAGVKVRDKRAKEAATSKKTWQSRIGAIAAEEAAMKREVDELAGALLLCGKTDGHPAKQNFLRRRSGPSCSRFCADDDC